MFASNSDSAETLVPAPDPAAMPGGSATPARRFVVGIGASAGGLEALSTLLPNLPCDLGLTYVVVQHLSPTYRSMPAQLLGRETSMTVKDVEDGGELVPNTVYITPANRNLLIQDGRFRLIEPTREALPKPSINRFFASLAAQMNDSAIGIVLSGTGSDGASGIHAIKAAGGFTFAQEPTTAKYNGMPQAAIDTGSVDWILPPERIGQEITLIARTQGAVPLEQKPEAEPATLKKLLAKVRQHTRIDFSGYKEATLWRRIGRRMATNHVVDLDEYLQLIAERPEELEKLAKDILISVTAFFRDKEAFASLSTVVGRIVADKQPGEEIRVWVPGCATGEEAYSIAILFAEHLGNQLDQYRVQIFATDLDLDAMAMARRALFPASSLADLDPRQLRQYFVAHGDRYELAKPLRELVIFARQDLAQDPPFLRLDLISCRNVLIYFRSELQVRILGVFQYGLRPGGHLFLGRSESVFHQEALFEVVDKEARLYRRRRGTQKLLFQTEPRFSPQSEPRKASDRPPKDLPELLREQAVRLFLPVSLLVDEQLRIKHIHGDASRYLIIPSGKPSFDLLNLIRPELRTDLQTLIFQSGREQTSTQGRPQPLKGEPSATSPVRMSVHPLLEENSEKLFLICFEPAPASAPARGRKSGPADDHTHKELEDELAATREHLQTLVEELETSNEEMQALNEEVQASNEELQASNEELQSTNEELTTLNEELQVKTSELEEANTELESGLRLALEKDELFLHYQPQIDARSRRVVGIEALLRWRRADGSYVTPGEFILIAEQSTLIVTLSQWVIDQLCRQILIWDHIKLPPVRVSFNVAARHFRHAQILATLNECIGRYAIDPTRLCLELTEDALLDDAAHARTILEEIKRIGLSISIDDFGSGYFSLACLRSYPIDELKIDQRFVADMTSREDSRAIAATITAIGNTLGLRVVAEGVETAEQMALLSEQGCHIMQGYHIANPMSASALADWIRYRLEEPE